MPIKSTDAFSNRWIKRYYYIDGVVCVMFNMVDDDRGGCVGEGGRRNYVRFKVVEGIMFDSLLSLVVVDVGTY